MDETLKLKPHIFAELAGELRDTAVKYKDTQQLRAQLIKTLNKYIKPDHGSLTQ